jgi:hypothetical protein
VRKLYKSRIRLSAAKSLALPRFGVNEKSSGAVIRFEVFAEPRSQREYTAKLGTLLHLSGTEE